MPGNYTAREVATVARKWGFYIDEARGGPGHVALMWKGNIVATMRHPLRPARGFTSPIMLKKLASKVGVDSIDAFMAGPAKAKPSPLEVEEPPPVRKEQQMAPETAAGYNPPSTRKRLVQQARKGSLTRTIEQVLCVMDREATAEEVYVEAVKHIPYITVPNVTNCLENAAYTTRIRSEGKQVSNRGQVDTSIVRTQYSNSAGGPAKFAISPRQWFPPNEIEDLPDWRPRAYKPRKAKRKPTVSAAQRAKIVENRERRAEEKAKETVAPPVVESPPSANGQTPPVFEAMFRRFDDPEVVIIRDDQGDWWEARRVPGFAVG